MVMKKQYVNRHRPMFFKAFKDDVVEFRIKSDENIVNGR
jgi:hypothetical protein